MMKDLCFRRNRFSFAAIDLTAADRIAIIQQQGENTSQFVLQTREHPERMEQVVLTASSPTEAKRWVDALIMRREYFQKLLKIVPKTSLANNKAEAGRRLFSTLTPKRSRFKFEQYMKEI